MGGDTTELHTLPAYERHIVSFALEVNHPYRDDLRSHLGDNEVSQAFGGRCFHRLAELLRRPSLSSAELVAALDTCTELASEPKEKNTAVDAGIGLAASDLLLHTDVQVQRSAVRVLAALALHLCGRECLAQCQTVDRLAELLLSSDDDTVKANVAACMRNFAIARDGCQNLVDRGGVHAVGCYLKGALPPETRTGADCVVGLLTTLRHVAVTAQCGVRDLVGLGVLGKIVLFLERAASIQKLLGADGAEEALVAAASVLANAGADKTARHELISAGAIPTLTALLTHEAQAVREYALQAVYALSLDLQAKKALVEFSPQIADFLLLTNESAHAVETCRRLVLSGCELPAFRLQVTKDLCLKGGTPVLRAVLGVACCAPLVQVIDLQGKGKLWKQQRRSALSALEEVLQETEHAPGDTVFVPPKNPKHLASPCVFCLETCPGVMDHLLRFLPMRTGEVNDSAEAALRCLELLSNVAEGQEELKRLMAKTEHADAKLQPKVKARLDAMRVKATKNEEQENVVNIMSIKRASKQAKEKRASSQANVVLVSEDGTERLTMDDGVCNFRWEIEKFGEPPASLEITGQYVIEGSEIALHVVNSSQSITDQVVVGVMQGEFGKGDAPVRVSFVRDFAPEVTLIES